MNASQNSLMKELFGSAEGFLAQRITDTYGNAGYTTSNVEKWSLRKEIETFTGWDHLKKGRIGKWAKQLGFGLFGGSPFRSTRYFYNFIQSVQPINSGFITDPVQTYAMSAALQKQDVSQAVQQSLKSGLGYKLKQYYQYHKHRFKNRAWKYTIYKSTNFTASVNTFDEQRFLQNLPKTKKYRLIDVNTEWSDKGHKYEEWLQKTFNIDSFNNSDQQPLHENGRPEEQSVGMSLWSASTTPIHTYNFPTETVKSTKQYEITKRMSLNQEEEYLIYRGFTNPYQEESSSNDNIEINPYETVHTVKIKLVNVNGTEKTYEVTEILRVYKYNQEHFYWLDKKGKSNYSGFASYWNIEDENQDKQDVVEVDKDKIFKFYPPIPIRDWLVGKDRVIQTIPRFEGKKLAHLQGKLKDVSKELQDAMSWQDKEKATPNSAEGGRITNKTKRNQTSKQRDISRLIQRELNRSRTYKYNRDRFSDINKYDEKRLKRHIEHMASLVGVDYISYVTGLMTQSAWWGGHERYSLYQSCIYLGAKFADQSLESMEYWYEWAKRQYRLAGAEQSFNKWKGLVQSASSLHQLPQQIIKFHTTDGTHWGGWSFCFIKKITIKGRLRKIKRQRRYKDILRGRPITISSIAQLKKIIEPPNALASDEYYYNPHSKKEYPIGGGGFSGYGYVESGEPSIDQVFQNYHYTLFAKQSGADEITAYAICGLQFHTKVEDKHLWCTAWQDLEWEYQRLRAKYINNNEEPEGLQIRIEDSRGRKYRYIRHAYYMGILPLEYDVIKRMNATTLERFTQKATLNYSWYFQEQKGKRSSMKYYAPIIQVVAFIVSLVLAPFTGGQSLWINVLANVLIGVAVGYLVKLAITHLILPLLKALGLKGLVAHLVIIIIMILAYYFGSGGASQSAAPVASQTTGKAAEKVGTQAVQQTVKETSTEAVKQTTVQGFQSVMKEMGKQIFNQVVGGNLAQLAANTISYVATVDGEFRQEEMAKLNADMEAEKEASKKAFKELEAMQEELLGSMAQFSREAVLGEFTKNVIRMQDFGLQYEKGLDSIGAEGTLEYLWGFLDMRISNDVEYADPINVTQFKVG